MKTTVEISEDLLIAAKRHAAGTRTTLRALIERGLRGQLSGRARGAPRRARIRWVTVDGGLPEGLDPGDRAAMMSRLVRRP
jgi:hypothetical protein